MTKLLPCPFCGAAPVFPNYDAGDDDYVVMCKSCGAASRYDDEQDAVIAAWNQRAATPDVAQDAVTPDETGWVIEKDDPPVYHLLSDDYDEHWTSDVNKALRFARKEDAEAYISHVGWTSPSVRTAEHMWVPPRVAMPLMSAKGSLIQTIEAEARRYAEMYPQSSDGRNTFVLFADWVAGLAAPPIPEGHRVPSPSAETSGEES